MYSTALVFIAAGLPKRSCVNFLITEGGVMLCISWGLLAFYAIALCMAMMRA